MSLHLGTDVELWAFVNVRCGDNVYFLLFNKSKTNNELNPTNKHPPVYPSPYLAYSYTPPLLIKPIKSISVSYTVQLVDILLCDELCIYTVLVMCFFLYIFVLMGFVLWDNNLIKHADVAAHHLNLTY